MELGHVTAQLDATVRKVQTQELSQSDVERIGTRKTALRDQLTGLRERVATVDRDNVARQADLKKAVGSVGCCGCEWRYYACRRVSHSHTHTH